MKKILAFVLAAVMALSLAACGNKAEVINDFGAWDTAKFHGCINGDGDFLVMYEGMIDQAVMGAVLMTEDGASVTISEQTLAKNPDGNSLLFFEQVEVEVSDTVRLILEKEGYETLEFDVIVE